MDYLRKLFNLEDKVTVITGATGNLGSVICEAFKEAGSRVIGLDVNIKKNRINGVEYRKMDIVDRLQVKDIFDKIASEYKSIDVLINNVGVSVFGPFEKRKEEHFDFVMDVNLKGTFFCIQNYVRIFDRYKMKKGTIINIASFYGIISPDFRIYTDCKRRNSEIYGATKAGVIQMTKYFAVHLASRNIRVNAISPGGIYDPKNPQGNDFIKNYSYRCPMKRMAEYNEIAGGIIYLSSDAASYTTGTNIIIDGGMSCW